MSGHVDVALLRVEVDADERSEPVADAEGEEGVVRLGPVVGFLPLQAPRLVVYGVELPHLEPDAPFLRDVPLQLQADRGGDDVAAEERMVRPLAVARVEAARWTRSGRTRSRSTSTA